MALGDGRNNAAFAGLIGQFARCPMAHWAFRRLGWLTGQCDNLAPLLGAERGRGAGALRVLQAFRDGATVAGEPMAAPAPDCGACCAEAACYIGGIEALSQQEDNLCPKTQVLGCLVGTNQCAKCLVFFLRE
jgi:hypothetical protein